MRFTPRFSLIGRWLENNKITWLSLFLFSASKVNRTQALAYSNFNEKFRHWDQTQLSGSLVFASERADLGWLSIRGIIRYQTAKDLKNEIVTLWERKDSQEHT